MKNLIYKILGVLILAGVAYVDFITHHQISTMIFYLIPIAFAALLCGRRWGIAFALFSSALWFAADVLSGEQYANNYVPYWNAFVRMIFFMFIVLAVELRNSWRRERERSRIDYLTGVSNRKNFYEILSKEMDRCRRYKRPFTVVFLDCDEFKALNDRFGHQKGDAALSLVARTIKTAIRTTDTVARFGGDEFVILMVEADQEPARQFLERLRATMLGEMERNGLPITFSFGAVTFISPPSTVDEVIKKADALMYSAKNGGKNAIVFETVESP